MKRSLALAASLGARHAWMWRYGASFGDRSSSREPRLLVDVSAIIRHDAQTGIQRVVRAVWTELSMRSGAGFDVLPVFATSSHGYCYANPDFLSRKVTEIAHCPVRVRSGDKFLGLDLSAHLLPKYRRQLSLWRSHGATIHLIVYDLLPLNRASWFTDSAVRNFRKWFELLVQEADQAICISDHVVHEIDRQLDARRCERRPKISRLRLGADMAASVPSSGVCDQLSQILQQMRFRPAILMVGTIEPRKGYETALAAFEHLWRSRPDSPDLVLVGRPGWKTEALQDRIRSHPEFGRRLQWLDGISDEGLCLLYEASRGLLMASRGEGWGLPLVEAAMHRRYVLARDLPVFHEHGLSNVLYFADDRPESLGERLLDLAEIGKEPAPAADLPNWSESVEGLLVTLGLAKAERGELEAPLRKAS